MPEKKKPAKPAKPGVVERARRKVASDTAGETGLGTSLKRGFAMIGAMATEAIAPSKNVPSRASLKAKHERKLSEKKAAKTKKGKAAMKKSEPRRRAAERSTGTSTITDRLRGVRALTEAAKKRKGG
jgi:hypothetical protein